jgi:hypothetical protein
MVFVRPPNTLPRRDEEQDREPALSAPAPTVTFRPPCQTGTIASAECEPAQEGEFKPSRRVSLQELLGTHESWFAVSGQMRFASPTGPFQRPLGAPDSANLRQAKLFRLASPQKLGKFLPQVTTRKGPSDAPEQLIDD